MSQAGSISGGGGGGGSSINEIDTQNGNATPIANVIILNGIDSSTNNDNGIFTQGGVVGTGVQNEVDVVLSNRQTATVTTADATLTTILTFPLGATAGTYYVVGNVQAFNASTPSGGGFSFSGGYLTDGATATELGTEYHDDFKSVALTTADIFLNVSGNNVLVQVMGVAGLSINWNSVLEYRRVF